MSTRQLWVRGVLRVMRWISWSGLALIAVLSLVNLETRARRGGLGLPAIEFALVELFAVFCCAVAVDRGLSLGEKTFHESD